MQTFQPIKNKKANRKPKKNDLINYAKQFIKQKTMLYSGFRSSSQPKFFQRKYVDAKKITAPILEYRKKLNDVIDQFIWILRNSRRSRRNKAMNDFTKILYKETLDEDKIIDTKNIMRKLKMNESGCSILQKKKKAMTVNVWSANIIGLEDAMYKCYLMEIS